MFPSSKYQPFHVYHSKAVVIHISCFIYSGLMFIKALIFHYINLWWIVMFAASFLSSPWSACMLLRLRNIWETIDSKQSNLHLVSLNANLTICGSKYWFTTFSSHPAIIQIHAHQVFDSEEQKLSHPFRNKLLPHRKQYKNCNKTPPLFLVQHQIKL